MGDLRTFRRAIIHKGGIVTASEFLKLKLMADLSGRHQANLHARPDAQLLVHVKRSISRLVIGHFNHLPGAPDPASIVNGGDFQPSATGPTIPSAGCKLSPCTR